MPAEEAPIRPLHPHGLAARRSILLAALAAPGIARAQPWTPERSITLLHGFGPGGAADTICRILAPPLAEALGRPVVVEPRPGAGGNIASAALAAAKARPRAMQYGTLGPGSSHHLTGELFSAAAGIEMTQVPYRSDVAGITAVMGGELPLMVSTSVGAMGMLQDPKLRGLAVTADRRSARFPAIPTVAESGFPGFRSYTWAGLAAPAATPAPIVAALHAALLRALAQPAVRAKLEELTDGEVDPSAPAATRALVVEEIEAWRGLIKARGLSAD
jgi:tripartite-type tricarboxylate transporter receptor subunit TctC